MSRYYFKKTITDSDFDSVIDRVTEKLKEQGFGVLTEIDVKETFRKKLDVDFRKYRILGACNPEFAHKAIEFEPYIGAMLPCNVVVQENEDGGIDVTAVDPVASMAAVENEELGSVATQVRDRLKQVIEAL